LTHVDSPRSQNMPDSNQNASNSPGQPANAQRGLTDGVSGIISFGPYRLIATRRRLELAGRPVPLGDREFYLLCAQTAEAQPAPAKATAPSGTVTSSMQPSRRCKRARRALSASIP
jgi:hypothetical protein